MPANLLTAKTVHNAKPGAKPRKLTDGDGLHLLISTTGAKLWRDRYRIGAERWIANCVVLKR